MEIAPYCFRERGVSLAQLIDVLSGSGYCFARLDGEAITIDVQTFEDKIQMAPVLTSLPELRA